MAGHLPDEASSFVGRAAELARVDRALRDGTRVVTLTGTGGVGKSRLAVRAARRAAGRYPHGACWADLSPLQNDRRLVATVSEAVGLRDHTLRGPVEALCERLAGQRLLLVLDACERVVESVAHLVADLVTAVPGLTVLATSRRPLGIRGERVVAVGPLPTEGDEEEALRLFRDRAAQAAPHAALDDAASLAAASEICRVLEGIPLAVELASARLADHTVEEIADRLGSRVPAPAPVLDGVGAPAGPARFDLLVDHTVWPQHHRALRTAVGWSHELCRPLERLLWARLSAFRGDFGVEDAAAVCAGGPLGEDAVAEALAGLVAQSVVQRTDTGTAAAPALPAVPSGTGGPRHRMLATLREYGAMWLDELGTREAVADLHALHYADLVARAYAGWSGAGQVGWYHAMRDSHADLCAALNHLLATDPERATAMAGAVGFYWTCCGHLHEARLYLERCLAEDRRPRPERTRALWALGVTVVLQGDLDGARVLGERCAIAAWQDGTAESKLAACYLQGLTCLMMGRPLAAHVLTEAVLGALPGDPFASQSLLRCHVVRVFALTALGRLPEARSAAEALRAACVAHGEYWARGYADYQLALIHLFAGDPNVAEGYARSMLGGRTALLDNFGTALGLDLLAATVAAQGDGERAAHVFGTGQAYWRTVGHPQRGTPELADVRAACERSAREAVGDAAYEEAFHLGLVAEDGSGLARALAGRLPDGGDGGGPARAAPEGG
ncbi:ATP-binding protein [Streptomyces fuscigenes]|uniref:ATP-binding protein n=1 Tax=Streptomyces fuscigenes TaxID=1528880 RepID=UPI001F364EC2|nr:NB-ARC domain-containing protein [Streptomyces fuscigenes]MCF3963312.1 NB-ARC domain-containing protein [Streptomyces fuscigenes]